MRDYKHNFFNENVNLNHDIVSYLTRGHEWEEFLLTNEFYTQFKLRCQLKGKQKSWTSFSSSRIDQTNYRKDLLVEHKALKLFFSSIIQKSETCKREKKKID